jgi:phosphotransferase system HPr-like phosphotransfer protein
MTEVKILLNGIDKVKNFVGILSKFKDTEFDVVSGRYVINAKSAMGLFSLDITLPMDLQIMTEDEDTVNAVKEAIADFLI